MCSCGSLSVYPNPFSSFSCPPSNSEDRISKIMGRFPWQIVAAVQNTMLVTSNEHRGVVRSTTGLERILRAIQSDGGNADLGFCRQAGFPRCESRVACRCPETETIAVDNHIDEVRIIKGGSRPLEGGVVELPARRPLLPKDAAQLPTILR
jgi:hypothetical protein